MANTKSISLAKASTQLAKTTSLIGYDNGDATMEVWVKPAVTPTGNAVFGIVGWSSSGNHTDFYIRYNDNGGTPTLYGERIKQGVQQSTCSYVVTLPTNAWTHIVLRFDAGNSLLKLYTAPVAGSHTERSSVTSNSGNGTSDGQDGFKVGCANAYADSGTFDGLIDEVRFWGDVRSTTELNDNFETELVGNETDLLAYYKLNDNVEDTTAGNYDLTAINSPTYSSDVPFGGVAAPTVTTQAVSDVAATTATGNGNVTDDGGATITERGVCVSTSANPTTADAKFTATGTTGAFTASITGRARGTLYHVRAYAINSEGTSYGADVEFTTTDPQGISGVVTLAGSPVEGAMVRCIRQSTNTALTAQTTDSSGVYAFTGLTAAAEYHVLVEWETGGVKYNALSLWDVVPVDV